MSHIALQDFAGAGNLLRANGEPFQNGDAYTTVVDAPECGGEYTCRSTVYGHYQGASRPDGPGDWIKYSTINGVTAAIKSGNLVAKAGVPGPSCS